MHGSTQTRNPTLHAGFGIQGFLGRSILDSPSSSSSSPVNSTISVRSFTFPAPGQTSMPNFPHAAFTHSNRIFSKNKVDTSEWSFLSLSPKTIFPPAAWNLGPNSSSTTFATAWAFTFSNSRRYSGFIEGPDLFFRFRAQCKWIARSFHEIAANACGSKSNDYLVTVTVYLDWKFWGSCWGNTFSVPILFCKPCRVMTSIDCSCFGGGGMIPKDPTFFLFITPPSRAARPIGL